MSTRADLPSRVTWTFVLIRCVLSWTSSPPAVDDRVLAPRYCRVCADSHEQARSLSRRPRALRLFHHAVCSFGLQDPSKRNSPSPARAMRSREVVTHGVVTTSGDFTE